MPRIKAKKEVEDLDLLPVMNLFSILIPFLLSVAVFQKMAIVEVNMPERSPPDPNGPPPPVPDEQSLNLTVALTADKIELWARGGSLPSIYAHEIVEYQCEGERKFRFYPKMGIRFIAEDDKQKNWKQDKSFAGSTPKCINGTVEPTPYQKENIYMFEVARTSEEDPGTLLRAVYNSNDSALVDGENNFFDSKSKVKLGMVVQTLRESSARTLDSKKYKDVYEDYRNAYDELAKRLVGIHNKFIDMEDADNIIILADDKIEFDKIIQAMDVSREAGFWNIQLAKLGG
jgi:biopolymer transport protein ExbD